MDTMKVIDVLAFAIGLGGVSFGAAFFFAALEIKGKINLEVAKQFSEMALNQIKYQNQTAADRENLASKVRGWIDNNSAKIGIIDQRLDQVERYLEIIGQGHERPYHHRPRLDVDSVMPEDTQF